MCQEVWFFVEFGPWHIVSRGSMIGRWQRSLFCCKTSGPGCSDTLPTGSMTQSPTRKWHKDDLNLGGVGCELASQLKPSVQGHHSPFGEELLVYSPHTTS